jgi:hypothetical protein
MADRDLSRLKRGQSRKNLWDQWLHIIKFIGGSAQHDHTNGELRGRLLGRDI